MVAGCSHFSSRVFALLIEPLAKEQVLIMVTAVTSWVSQMPEPLVSALVSQGKITHEKLASVSRLRLERNISFSSAAMELGVLTPNDVADALERQREALQSMHDGILSPELAIAYDTHAWRAEVLRMLRYQLAVRWFADQAPRKALAVVSIGSGDGRSRLTAELAIVFAQAGERTLLVDADLRSPRQHTFFGLHNQSGLSSTPGDTALLASAVPVHSVENLFVVPSGPVPDASRSLLVLRRLEGMLEAASADFDAILLDTPPLDHYVDAQTIALAAGGALLSVRRDKAHVEVLRENVDLLQGIGVNLVGTTFSGF
jgi:protein-tyrosine kinase